MSYRVIEEIDSLYSEWSRMYKPAKLAYLNGQWDRLIQLAYQYDKYLKGRSSITPTEKQYAQILLEMINSVDTEGSKKVEKLVNDLLKESEKSLLIL